jgi:ribosomal protein S18 acetylase RimI-like enzyme/N-acetylglutamate synthase-like GNAT family acetyltransferase
MSATSLANTLSIRPIQKDEYGEFRKLCLDYIGANYDDIDETFANNILIAHEKGYDPLGYFTKTKSIWVLDREGEMLGFLVATEKRGGSVKFAPGIMKPQFQKKGLGTIMWRNVENIYLNKGARKIYNHAPLRRTDLFKWVVTLGLKVEAYLVEQYRPAQDEYVAGKFLREPKATLPQITLPEEQKIAPKITIREYQDGDQQGISTLLLEEMPRWYDEIDQNFVESIITAIPRFEESFRKKGKRVFVVESREEIIAVTVVSPKRGGAVKLVPFTMRPDMNSCEIGERLLRYIQKKVDARKLYALVPTTDLVSVQTFRSLGFRVEGLLREPYKSGVDNIFLGNIL